MKDKDNKLIWEAWTNEQQLGQNTDELTDSEKEKLQQAATPAKPDAGYEFTDEYYNPKRPEFFEFDGPSGQGAVYIQNANGQYYNVYFTWNEDGEYDRGFAPVEGGGTPGEEPYIDQTQVYNIKDDSGKDLEDDDPLFATAQRMIENYFNGMGLTELGHHSGAELPSYSESATDRLDKRNRHHRREVIKLRRDQPQLDLMKAKAKINMGIPLGADDKAALEKHGFSVDPDPKGV